MEQQTVYNPVARALHWGIFALVGIEFAIAWIMPDMRRGTLPTGWIAWHIGVGTSILVLMLLRLLWRLLRGAPELLPGPVWQQRLAGLVHVLLYAGFLLLPLLGWNPGRRAGRLHAGLAQCTPDEAQADRKCPP